MTSPQPVAPRRVRQYRGLLGRCAFLVPAVIFGAWRLAGAQEGPHGGDMAPFLVAFAAILVAAKVGGELVERLGQPAVLGELLVGAGQLRSRFDLRCDPFLPSRRILLRSRSADCNLKELRASAVGVALVVAPVALGYAVSSAFLPGEHGMSTCSSGRRSRRPASGSRRALRDIGRIAPESKVILGAAVVDAGNRSRAGARACAAPCF